ncbi:MAG: radical SAM protein [Candidatus Lokiarchaeota archaeon]|nr:radical SAM protein [Candidatus Lokiarchaeota archaeon]
MKMYKKILLAKPVGAQGLGIIVGALIPLGMEYIAAAIEDQVEEIRMLDRDIEHFSRSYFKKYLELYEPDLVGFTMSATEHNDGLALAKIAKQCGADVVCGGFHPTAVPELLLNYPYIDYVIRGEGELTMRELIEEGPLIGTSRNEILGLSYRDTDGTIIHNNDRPLIEDIDSLPFPARHLRRKPELYRFSYAPKKRADQINFLRGCYGTCTFCCEPRMSKSRVRFRKPEKIIEELERVVEFHNYRPIHMLIADPNIMASPKRISEICDYLIEYQKKLRYPISFNAMITCYNVAQSPKIFSKLIEAGIDHYCAGLESPSHEDLVKTKKKVLTNKYQKDYAKILRTNKAIPGGTFVIGLDWHTKENIKKFPEFAKEIGMLYTAYGIATPFPDTDFYDAVEDRIYEKNWNKFDEMHGVYTLKGDNIRRGEMECLNAYCLGKFYSPDILFDQIKLESERLNKKISLLDFLGAKMQGLFHMTFAGLALRRNAFRRDGVFFFKGMADAKNVKQRTAELNPASFIDMSRFLKIIGNQKLQISFINNKRSLLSVLIKTSFHKLDYIDTDRNKLKDGTIDFDIPYSIFEENSLTGSYKKIIKILLVPFISLDVKNIIYRTRLFLALFVEGVVAAFKMLYLKLFK